MTVDEVLRLWEGAAELPLRKSPTLMQPLETHALEGGEVLEVHSDGSGTYRLILVRRKDRRLEEVRVVKH